MSRSYRHSDYIKHGKSDKQDKAMSHRHFRRVERAILASSEFQDSEYPEKQGDVYNQWMFSTRSYFGDHEDAEFVAKLRRK